MSLIWRRITVKMRVKMVVIAQLATSNLRHFSYDFQNLEPETKSVVPEPHGYTVANSLCIEANNVDEDNSLPRLSQ